MSLRYTSDLEITDLQQAPTALSGREALIIVQDNKTYKTTLGEIIANQNLATLPTRPDWELVQNKPSFSGCTVGNFTVSGGQVLYNGEATFPGVVIPKGQIQHFVDLIVSDGASAEITLPSGNDYAGVMVGIRAKFPVVAGWTQLSDMPYGFLTPTEWTQLPATPIPEGFQAPPPATPVAQVLVEFYNESLRQIWTAPTAGYIPPTGWAQGNPVESGFVYTSGSVDFYNAVSREIWTAPQPGYRAPTGWSEGNPSLNQSFGQATLKVRDGSSSGPIIQTLDSDLDQDTIDAAWFFNNGANWKTFPAPQDALTL